MVNSGYKVFPYDRDVARWATSAKKTVDQLDTSERRHGGTWFVGVDALPNDQDGSINGTQLIGSWDAQLAQGPPFGDWHNAQISIVYPNYPRKDADESNAAHRFRVKRDAAHVDGLLPEGASRKRHLREPHAFILGLPLNNVTSAPLVVWPGSQHLVRQAFLEVFKGHDPRKWGDLDVTDIYQSTRKKVFDTCPRVELPLGVGQAVLLDRHLVHGVAPWDDDKANNERTIAYFRPMVRNIVDWL